MNWNFIQPVKNLRLDFFFCTNQAWVFQSRYKPWTLFGIRYWYLIFFYEWWKYMVYALWKLRNMHIESLFQMHSIWIKWRSFQQPKNAPFLQYLCDKTTISMCKNMHYDQTIHNGLKAVNAMVTKMYSAYNICMKAKEKFGWKY